MRRRDEMPSHRFLYYCPEVTRSSSDITLSGDEHRHLARVLRCGPDDTAYITNGRGLILECRVTSVGRSATEVKAVAVTAERQAEPEFVLALGAIRKDKFEQAFEQCVELGITRCVPFVSANARSKGFGSHYLERLRKIAVAAIKQSFQPILPHVGELISFEELARLSRGTPRVIVGRQGASPVVSGVDTSTLVVVGPEAGLTDGELAALRDVGAVFAGVSPNRLRSETAAVALVAALARND